MKLNVVVSNDPRLYNIKFVDNIKGGDTELFLKECHTNYDNSDIKDGHYDRKCLDFVTDFLKDSIKGTMAIDAGMSIGCNSINYSKIFQLVYSFEPMIDSALTAKFNMIYNNCDNVIVFNNAVYVCDTDLSMNISKYQSLSSISLTNKGIHVDAVKLDSIDFPLRVSFIKIDTEGFDLFALMGATMLIQSDRPLIQIEVNTALRNSNTDENDIYNFLKLIDYHAVDIKGRLIEDKTQRVHNSINIFLIPNEFSKI